MVHKRRVKLISPFFQLKLVGIFLLLSVGSLVVQLFLTGMDLRMIAGTLPPGNQLETEVPGILTRAFLFSVGMWLPITLGVGILVTHRIAGPVYRFEKYFEALAGGEEHGECSIRKDDEFGELCKKINTALIARGVIGKTGQNVDGAAASAEAESLRRAG